MQKNLLAVLILPCAVSWVLAKTIATTSKDTVLSIVVPDGTISQKIAAGTVLDVVSRGTDGTVQVKLGSLEGSLPEIDVLLEEKQDVLPTPGPTPKPTPTPAVAGISPSPGASVPQTGGSQFAVVPGSSKLSDVPEINKVPNKEWKLVWSDEFSDKAIDRTKWDFEVNGDGGGNGEMQYYTDKPENAYIDTNGILHIKAIKEDYKGKRYTSAHLVTKGKHSWLYGRFEARLKLPKGKGYWPAFWMMPADSAYGGWARSGEIDIMENIGDKPNIAYGTLHYGDKWPKNIHTGDKYTLSSGDFSDDFHVFALEWEPGIMRWYIDEKIFQVQTQWNTKGGNYPAPFDQKFFFIMNVAVGGAWPGPPSDSTKFPQTMDIDYVRVYQP